MVCYTALRLERGTGQSTFYTLREVWECVAGPNEDPYLAQWWQKLRRNDAESGEWFFAFSPLQFSEFAEKVTHELASQAAYEAPWDAPEPTDYDGWEYIRLHADGYINVLMLRPGLVRVGCDQIAFRSNARIHTETWRVNPLS